MQTAYQKILPHYRGQKWLHSQLPDEATCWLDSKRHGIRKRKTAYHKTKIAVTELVSQQKWKWPKRPIIFISDMHADAQAFIESLVASGGIKKTGPHIDDFKLTKFGKKALFIFGGDFFDKGPSNLALLDALKCLIDKKARVHILAGNHDIRILFGMRSVGNTDDPRNGHFFIRMGAKAIPFLCEIRDRYLYDDAALAQIPREKDCARLLFPSEHWWKKFPDLATWVMSKAAIEHEMRKIKKKVSHYTEHCQEAGISLREAYAAARKWQDLFLKPDGAYHWFFKRMDLCYRKGSLLFIHAGLDDRSSMMLNEHGATFINQLFHMYLSGSPFEFYYSPIANGIRTKYRSVDMPLSKIAQHHTQSCGIHAIVHGHRNLHHGQRIAMRKNILHFECDVTLDAGSRAKEGLQGVGAGATIIHPQGCILGISSDYKHIKVFDPKRLRKSAKKLKKAQRDEL